MFNIFNFGFKAITQQYQVEVKVLVNLILRKRGKVIYLLLSSGITKIKWKGKRFKDGIDCSSAAISFHFQLIYETSLRIKSHH